MKEDEVLSKFIEDMIAEKDFDGLSEEARDYIATDLKSSFLNLLNRSVIEAMPDDKIEELNKLLDDDSKTIEDMQKFVSESGVDAKQITLDVMFRFRELYLRNPEERESQNKVQEA
jgi:dihydropteroate synthase